MLNFHTQNLRCGSSAICLYRPAERRQCGILHMEVSGFADALPTLKASRLTYTLQHNGNQHWRHLQLHAGTAAFLRESDAKTHNTQPQAQAVPIWVPPADPRPGRRRPDTGIRAISKHGGK